MTSPHLRSPSRSNTTHAYSIVTTSTALLTRSNSTNTHLNTHSYSPSSPSTITHSPSHRHDYRRHRHSKSLSTISLTPPSLPPPPPSSSESDLTPPTSRARTLSDLGSLSDSGSDCSDAYDSSSETDVLVDNPLLWSSERLSDYLVNENMQSLADLVARYQITGREFTSASPSLELSTALQSLPENLRGELYIQARKLRVISFKFRIMGRNNKLVSQTSNHQSQGYKVKSMVRNLEQHGSPLPGSRVRTWSTSSSSSSASVALSLNQLSNVRSATTNDQWSPGTRNTTISSRADRTQSMDLDRESGAILSATEFSVAERQHLRGTSVGLTGDCTFPEEPSMEHLLRLDQPSCSNAFKVNSSWGAKAWEDAVDGMTVKKLPPTPLARNTLIDEFGLSKAHVSCSSDDQEAEQSRACVPKNIDSSCIEPTLEGQQTSHSIDASSTSQPEDVGALRAHITYLESRIRELEVSKVATGKVATVETVDEGEGPAVFDLDLPQYLLMAGIGVCAIVVRRLMGMKT